MRLDAAGHDDLAGGVDHAPRLEPKLGQAEGDDALPLDGHVPPADALRRHDVASANQQIQHGSSSHHVVTGSASRPRARALGDVLDGYHASGRRVKAARAQPPIASA